MPPGFIFDQQGPAFFPYDSSQLFAHLAFLNSSMCRYLAHAFNPTLHIKCGDIQSMPAITDPEVLRSLTIVGRTCVQLAREIAAEDLREWAFQARYLARDFPTTAKCLAVLHTLETLIDDIVFSHFHMSKEAIDQLFNEIGRPSGAIHCEDAEGRFAEIALEYGELGKTDVEHAIKLMRELAGDETPSCPDCETGPAGSWLEAICQKRRVHPLDGLG